MKITKRLAAFFAAVAMVVLLIPGAAFAADPISDAVTISKDTYTLTYVDKDGKTVKPTTLERYTSGITIVVNFTMTSDVTNAGKTLDYTAAIQSGCDFAQTTADEVKASVVFGAASVGAKSVSGKSSFTFTNVKYFGEGNSLKIAVYKGTSTVGTETLTIGECGVTVASPAPSAPVETAAPTAVPTEAPTAAPTATPAPAVASGLIVKSSSIGTDSVNAGDDFTLSLTIYATTSGNTAANDVVVAVTPDKGVVIASGSSTQYIGTLKPGASKTVSFPMRAQADFTEGVSVVAVSVTGTGADGTGALSSSTNVSVPVLQADRFEISNVEVPQSLMVGEEGTATFTFVNKGKNPVGNLTFALACDNIQEASQNQYVGNLAAGTEDSVDFSLIPLAAGQLSGTVTVTYEAPGGKTVTLTQQLNATVEESYVDSGMTGGDSGMVDPSMGGDVAPAGLPGWAVGLIVVGSLSAVVIVVVIVRKQKAKKKAKLEAEDEDL